MASLCNFLNKKEKTPIAAMKAKKLSLARRRACIKKKTMELSVLCGVDACVFIVDGGSSSSSSSPPEVETWPENQRDVLKVINQYKKFDQDIDEHNKENKQYSVDDSDDDQDIIDDSWDDYLIDGLPRKSLEEVFTMVDEKLKELVGRIEVVKMIKNSNSSSSSPPLGEEYLSLQTPYNPNPTTTTTFPDENYSRTQTLMDFFDDQSPSLGCRFNNHHHGNNNNDTNNIPSASGTHEQTFLYMQPVQINPNFNIQPTQYFGQQSDQFLYYLPAGQFHLQLPSTRQFTANGHAHGLFPGQTF